VFHFWESRLCSVQWSLVRWTLVIFFHHAQDIIWNCLPSFLLVRLHGKKSRNLTRIPLSYHYNFWKTFDVLCKTNSGKTHRKQWEILVESVLKNYLASWHHVYNFSFLATTEQIICRTPLLAASLVCSVKWFELQSYKKISWYTWIINECIQ